MLGFVLVRSIIDARHFAIGRIVYKTSSCSPKMPIAPPVRNNGFSLRMDFAGFSGHTVS